MTIKKTLLTRLPSWLEPQLLIFYQNKLNANQFFIIRMKQYNKT